MPVAYPTNLRLPLRASKSRSQPAAFNYDRPRRGTGYARPIGSNVPVFWTLTWRLTEAEAVTFLRWFTHDLDRGRLEFALPVRTEFGLSDYTCLFLPDDLMTAREEGALWTYTATVMARELVVPEPVQTSAIQQRESTSTFATNGRLSATHSSGWPGVSQTGDLGVWCVFTEPGRTITVTSGGPWQLVGTMSVTGIGRGGVCSVFSKIKQPGDTNSGISVGSGTVFIAGQIFSYFDQSADFVDAVDVLENQASSATVAFPEISTEYQSTRLLIISITAAAGFPSFTIGSQGNTTGFAERTDSGWSSGSAAGIRIMIARASMPANGSIGVLSGTSSSAAAHSSMIIALR